DFFRSLVLAEAAMSQDASRDEIELLVGRMRSAAAPLRGTLGRLHEQFRNLRDGTVANYIPELAKADPDWFGISLVTADGQQFEVGDCEVKFSIQSVSKPFVFGLALEDHGLEQVLARVGVEPTGDAFNSIVLDELSNRPFNPMVNAGAIATADLVKGADYPERVGRLLEMFARYVGHEVFVDNKVFVSERATGHRNRAIGHLMRNFEMVSERFEESLELYFQQCSILVTCHDGDDRRHAGQPRCEPRHQRAGDRSPLREVPLEHDAHVRNVRPRRRMGFSHRAPREKRRGGRNRGRCSRPYGDRRFFAAARRQREQCPRCTGLRRTFAALRIAHLRSCRGPPVTRQRVATAASALSHSTESTSRLVFSTTFWSHGRQRHSSRLNWSDWAK